MSLNFVSYLASSADPDEMPRYVAFHLGIHCLAKYLFTGTCIQNERSFKLIPFLTSKPKSYIMAFKHEDSGLK